MKQVGVLGNGVTAKAVKAFLLRSKDYEESNIDTAELIITSPGIPPKGWPNASAEIISDIEFAFRILKERRITPKVVGITGTNGKTTVAAGLAHVLGVEAYGNIGVPLIDHIEEISNQSTLVLELSSFQLKSSPLLMCDIAIITNITEDHLEWHQSFENYESAKLSIIKSSNQIVILPEAYRSKLSVAVKETFFVESLKAKKVWFSEFHNQQNFAIIEIVASKLGVHLESIHLKLDQFELPPFRCQKIQNKLGIEIINDSKSTNMGATLAAVKCYQNINALILSGQPKSNFSDEWAEVVLRNCQNIYAAGDLAITRNVFPEKIRSRIKFYSSLKLATNAAIQNHSDGVILFSPGAASFDEFESYFQRGKAFNEYVNKY